MADEGDKIDALDRIYALVSAAAYCPTPQGNIKGYNLIFSTKTMVVYTDDNEIIYGFRGTSDSGDIATNIVMGVRGVENTSRYKKELEKLISIRLQEIANILGLYFQKKKNGKRRATVYELQVDNETNKTDNETNKTDNETNITFTGHSLGGSIAIQIYKTTYNQPGYNSKCVVFDPYVPINQENFIPKEIDQKNIKIYRIKRDLVSVNVDKNSKNYLVEELEKDSKQNVHSLHQFVDYKDEGDVCAEGKEYEEMVMRF